MVTNSNNDIDKPITERYSCTHFDAKQGVSYPEL